MELKSKFDPNFVKAVEVTGTTCTAKVPKLEEGQQYQFRVRAVNKAGPGEPSEPTLQHIAKPRFRKYFSIFKDYIDGDAYKMSTWQKLNFSGGRFENFLKD